MQELLIAIASLAVLVGGLLLFAASFGLVEDVWDALVRGVSRRLPAAPPPAPAPETRRGAEPMPEPDNDQPAHERETRDEYFISTEGMPPGFAKFNFDFGGSYEQQFGRGTKPERDERDGAAEREDPPLG